MKKSNFDFTAHKNGYTLFYKHVEILKHDAAIPKNYRGAKELAAIEAWASAANCAIANIAAGLNKPKEVLKKIEEIDLLPALYNKNKSAFTVETKEIRVYCIDFVENDDGTLVKDLPDDKFMEIAEEQGLVYTLQGFEINFNNNDISDEWIIRFIETGLNL